MNIVDEVFRACDPKAPALIEKGVTITYGELSESADVLTGDFGDLAGKRIGLAVPNGAPHIALSLGVLKAGGTLVPVASELSAPERNDLARTSALHGVVARDGKVWVDARAREMPAAGAMLWEFNHPAEPAFDEHALVKMNPALIRFSSGTTGRRKGIVISHESLLARIDSANAGLQVGPGDRIIWTLPMAHHFAVSIILYLWRGAAVILESSHLGEDVWRALDGHGATFLYASPFHYALLAACAEAHAVPSLRLAVSTAVALPEATAKAFRARFGIPLTQALGIIECGLPLMNRDAAATHPESVGRPQPGWEAEIRDENGTLAIPGSTGGLFLRGPGIADACLSPWQTRAQFLEDGWFRTGDQARMLENGAFVLAGRAHSAINVGGMKCFPEEVEEVLNRHPGVRESRVTAIHHPGFGSAPVAELVPNGAPPTPLELSTYCRTQLSNYKVPVRFSFVSGIPKTASVKILR